MKEKQSAGEAALGRALHRVRPKALEILGNAGLSGFAIERAINEVIGKPRAFFATLEELQARGDNAGALAHAAGRFAIERMSKDLESALDLHAELVAPREDLVAHVREQIAADPERYANRAKLEAIAPALLEEISKTASTSELEHLADSDEEFDALDYPSGGANLCGQDR